jgi:hypothetical protein
LEIFWFGRELGRSLECCPTLGPGLLIASRNMTETQDTHVCKWFAQNCGQIIMYS